MRYIDAYNHFFPKRYYEALLETPAGQKDLGKRVRGIPALSDLDLQATAKANEERGVDFHVPNLQEGQ